MVENLRERVRVLQLLLDSKNCRIRELEDEVRRLRAQSHRPVTSTDEWGNVIVHEMGQ